MNLVVLAGTLVALAENLVTLASYLFVSMRVLLHQWAVSLSDTIMAFTSSHKLVSSPTNLSNLHALLLAHQKTMPGFCYRQY